MSLIKFKVEIPLFKIIPKFYVSTPKFLLTNSIWRAIWSFLYENFYSLCKVIKFLLLFPKKPWRTFFTTIKKEVSALCIIDDFISQQNILTKKLPKLSQILRRTFKEKKIYVFSRIKNEVKIFFFIIIYGKIILWPFQEFLMILISFTVSFDSCIINIFYGI